jgi:hypothetical protein
VVLRTILREFTLVPTDAPDEVRKSRGVVFAPALGGRVVVRRRRPERAPDPEHEPARPDIEPSA